jgi:hypothetical protein
MTCQVCYNGHAIAVMAKEQNVNQTHAIAKLKKIIGPKFGYRVDKKAPDADERERRHAEAQRLRAEMQAADEARIARMTAVLAADAEYQRLKAAHQAAKREHESVPSWHGKPITVGRVGSMFFSVVADGDNWAEVVEKVMKQ